MPEENEVVVPETTQDAPVEVETPEESIEDIKARLAKAEEIANNQRIRAEKAEAKAKETPVAEASALSIADAIAITNAKVHEDDLERVERFAKSENLTIREALKNPELKAILDLRKEQRSSAEAANVSPSRRGPSQASEDVLLSNAAAGKLPENDAEIERLIAAKMKKG